MAEDAITSSLAALSRFFIGEGTLEDTLTQVAELTTQAVPPAELVGITLLVEGRHRTAIFTDKLAPEIDQAQYDADSGPCLDAFREHTVKEIQSTLKDGPWPEFRKAAAAHGVRSTLSLPLLAGHGAVGAMNLYANHERAFGPEHIDAATAFASQAAVVLANAHAYWDARELSSGLAEAMKHRAVIEQAKGMLMAAQGCDEDAAFEMLIHASQRENVKLRDVAQRIVSDAIARGRKGMTNGDAPIAKQ